MADDGSNDVVGSISVDITGDFSNLASAISDAQSAAAAGADAIAAAFNQPDAGEALATSITGVGQASAEATTNIVTLGEDTTTAVAALNEIQDTGAATTLESVSTAAGDAGTGLADIEGGASEAAAALQDVGSAATEANGELADLGGGDAGAALTDIVESADEASDALGDLDSATADTSSATAELSDSAEEAGEAGEESAEQWEKFGETLLELTGITLTIEGLKELASEAIEAFSTIQTASIALTALTGSATVAQEEIEGLESLASSDALSFPSVLQAGQRMIAFGLSTEQTNEALQDAANAAAATGNGFDTVSNALTRMVQSGTAGARQLVQLGITQQQLASIMGVSVTEITAAFKAMDPTDRLALIDTALQKFGGDAQLMANTVQGAWNQLADASEHTFATIGASIAPAITGLTQFAAYVVEGFGGLWQSTIGVAQTDFMNFMTAVVTGSTTGFAQFQADAQMVKAGADVIANAFGVADAAAQTWAGTFAEAIQKQNDAGQALDAAAKNLATATAGYQAGTVSLQVYQLAVQQWGDALNKASTDGTNFADSLLGIEQAQSKATTALAEAQLTLSQITPGTSDYARAVQAVGSAWNAANPGGVQFASTLMGLTQSANQSAANYRSLQAAFAQVSAGFQNGTTSAALFLDVANKLASAAKANGDAFANWQVDVFNLQQAQAQNNDTANASIIAFQQVFQQVVTGSASINELATAYKNAQAAAEKAGGSFSDAAAAALIATNAAQTQINTLGTDILTWGQLNSVVGQSPAQFAAAQTAMKGIETIASQLGISITQVGKNYTIAANSASPAVQALVQQISDWFTQQGVATTATINAGQAAGQLTTTVNQTGVAVTTFGTAASTSASKAASLATNVNSATSALINHTGAVANATAAHGALKGAVGSTVDVFGNLTTVLNVNGSQIISTTSAAQQLANAMSGDQAAADMLKASQQDLITTMQVGDSTITTVTSNVDLEAAAFEKLSQAMDQAAAAADGFTSANNAAGSSGGGAGAGGGLSGAGYASDILAASSLSNPVALGNSSMITNALGALGLVSTGGMNFESVAAYNAAIEASAKAIDAVTTTYTDQFGNVLEVIGKAGSAASTSLTSVATTAAAAAGTGTISSGLAAVTETTGNLTTAQAGLTTATTSLTTTTAQTGSAMQGVESAAGGVSLSLGTSEDAIAGFADSLNNLATATNAGVTTTTQFTIAQGSSTDAIEQELEAQGLVPSAAAATAAALQNATAAATDLVPPTNAATSSLDGLSSAATDASATLGSSANTLAQQFTQAGYTLVNGVSYIKTNAQANAQSGSLNGGITTGATPAPQTFTPVTAAQLLGSIFTSNPNAPWTPTTGEANPNVNPSITVNINAGNIVGQNGAQQLATMVQNQVITTLKQAGLKI